MQLDIATFNYIIRRYCFGFLIRLSSYICFVLSPFIPDSFLRLERTIFIIGCSRSGTTIFANMFGCHQDLSLLSEGAQIIEPDYYNPNKDHLKEENHVTKSDYYRIKMLFKLFTLLKGKKRLINKHPQNSLRIRFLKALFPDALFIHLIRDGRAVVESNYSKANKDTFRRQFPFGNFPKPLAWRDYCSLPRITQFAYQWVDILKYIRKTASDFLLEDEYIEVTYEEFCRNPHQTLNSLDIFCGLDPKRRNYSKIPPKFENQNFKWQSKLTHEEINQIKNVVDNHLSEFGYK